jgi:hypothetical protein
MLRGPGAGARAMGPVSLAGVFTGSTCLDETTKLDFLLQLETILSSCRLLILRVDSLFSMSIFTLYTYLPTYLLTCAVVSVGHPADPQMDGAWRMALRHRGPRGVVTS